jgi:cytochrome c3-like protein
LQDDGMTRRARNLLQIGVVCAIAFTAAAVATVPAFAQVAKAQGGVAESVAQPVPFSHKRHREKNIPCVLCHQTATSGETAGLPRADVCMTCHQTVAAGSPAIRKVAAYAKQHKPIHWARLYKIQDFVFFSHNRHANAKVQCSACHGKVCESDVLKQEVKFSMVFCVNCHKAKNATVKCNACHTLSM